MTYFPRNPNGRRTMVESQPVTTASDQLPAGYAKRIDEASDTVTYVGYANAGAVTSEPNWMIKKIEVIGNETSITWAEAGIDPNLVWDDRLSYTYE